MVAGSEHLGRATAKSVDAFLIVAEPTQTSIATALRIKKLSADMGIKNIFFVGNKIRQDTDADFLKKELKENLLGLIPFSKTLEENRGKFVFDSQLKEEFEKIYQELIRRNN